MAQPVPGLQLSDSLWPSLSSEPLHCASRFAEDILIYPHHCTEARISQPHFTDEKTNTQEDEGVYRVTRQQEGAQKSDQNSGLEFLSILSHPLYTLHLFKAGSPSPNTVSSSELQTHIQQTVDHSGGIGVCSHLSFNRAQAVVLTPLSLLPSCISKISKRLFCCL